MLVLSHRAREDRLQTLAARLPSPHLTIPLDVADETAVFSSAKQITEAFGRIDVLVHSAGLNITERSWDEITPSGWNEVIQVDLNGAFYCNQAVLPVMRDQKDGLIINVSSWAGDSLAGCLGELTGGQAWSQCDDREHQPGKLPVRHTRNCTLPREVATEILDRRPVPVSPRTVPEWSSLRMLRTSLSILSDTPHVCLNEITISPTWNRGYIRGA